jgi:hypothetical protein
MKLSEFKKLEKNIESEDFHKSYKNINTVMFCLSIFGQICSIFLAFFFCFKIMVNATDMNPYLAGGISVILLTGIELLKREIFDKLSIQQIKYKSLFHKNVIILFIFALMIISISFYSSIKGASEFSSKSKQIDLHSDVLIQKFDDSLNNAYNIKTELISAKIANKQLFLDKISDATLTHKIKPEEKTRIIDIKRDIEELKKDTVTLNKEKNYYINNFALKINEKANENKNENKNNSYIFVIISSIIEMIILIGVYFNEFYKHRSYNEQKEKLEVDMNYINFINSDFLLDTIYVNNLKINDKLPSTKALQDMCKINNKNLSDKEIIMYFRIFVSLGIFKTSGAYRYCLKNKENAKNLIKTHYNIE